jgi:hypothetical protein
MANPLETKLIVSDLDFDTIKLNLKNFLKSQSAFSDYDFDGSALSTLVDLLAYNTHYLGYYTNMLANESFMDTASLRDSVVSHAKMLGYTPTSARSAKANVTLKYTQADNPSMSSMTSLTLPRFTKFASSALNGINFSFTNLDEITVNKVSNEFKFENLTLTEGSPVSYVFTHNEPLNPTQEFLLPDANIDTSTIQLVVQNSLSDLSQQTFTLAEDATTVSNDSMVYFLEETNDNKYKIYFGDGILGKKLTDGNLIIVSYLLSRGENANKANKFTILQSVGGLANANVVVNTVAAGGAPPETIARVKYTAPKSYISNNRAVTKNDYIALIQKKYPSIEAVNVWGGEQNVPPIYGKVFISAKPKNGYYLTQSEKTFIVNEIINPIGVMTVIPEFIDADYNFLNLDITVNYNKSQTNKTPGQVQSAVKEAIYSFTGRELNNFNSYLKISRMMREIDNIDSAMVSNQINVKLEKRISPVLNAQRSYTLNFNTELKRSTGKDRIISYPAFIGYDNNDIQRQFFFEEIPLSFTGLSKIKVLSSGSGITKTPTLQINGDGVGAEARAIVTNGKITEVVIVNPGVEYSTATITAYDEDGVIVPNVSFQAVVGDEVGKMRMYFFDENKVKQVFSNEAGSIDYKNGVIRLNAFTAIDITETNKYLRFFAVPQNQLLNSSQNTILTLDVDDLAAVNINVIGLDQ